MTLLGKWFQKNARKDIFIEKGYPKQIWIVARIQILRKPERVWGWSL